MVYNQLNKRLIKNSHTPSASTKNAAFTAVKKAERAARFNMESTMADNDCRAALIKIATPLFAEKGFNGVSVRKIAALAGVNLSMISYYFGGKEGLYGEILNEQFAVLVRVAEIARLDADPLKKFEVYVRATVARYRQNPYLLKF
ncbi:MAG: hypothetical protein PVSMB11_10920 [Desulfuromonadaceae bacterium]